MVVVLASLLVFAFMLRKMLCWKLAESGSERVQFSTATRKLSYTGIDLTLILTDNPSCPCLTCTVKITQVGISEVVYSQGYNMDSEVCNHKYVLRHVTNNRL